MGFHVVDFFGGHSGPGQGRRITACWARPLGAVRPLLRPSWLMAEPRSTAKIWSPSPHRLRRPLQQHRPTTFTTHETVRAAEKALLTPRGESIPACDRLTPSLGDKDQVNAQSQCQFAFLVSQALHGQMDRDERGRPRYRRPGMVLPSDRLIRPAAVPCEFPVLK